MGGMGVDGRRVLQHVPLAADDARDGGRTMATEGMQMMPQGGGQGVPGMQPGMQMMPGWGAGMHMMPGW